MHDCGLLNVKIHIFEPLIEKSQTTCKTNVKNQEHRETVLNSAWVQVHVNPVRGQHSKL